jgi:hypothetical protein
MEHSLGRDVSIVEARFDGGTDYDPSVGFGDYVGVLCEEDSVEYGGFVGGHS